MLLIIFDVVDTPLAVMLAACLKLARTVNPL